MEYEVFCNRLCRDYPIFARYFAITPLIDYNYEQQFLQCMNNYMDDIRQERIVKASDNGEWLSYQELHEVQSHLDNYLFFHNMYLEFDERVKKQRRAQRRTEERKTITYSLDGYYYWVTLTPIVAAENKLRKFVENLKKLQNIKFLGCFENSKEGRFHLHIVIRLDKKIDLTKNPWRNYPDYFKPILLKSYQDILIKVRYCITDNKDGTKEEIFGDYEYFNNFLKSQTGQTVKKNFVMKKKEAPPLLLDWS